MSLLDKSAEKSAKWSELAGEVCQKEELKSSLLCTKVKVSGLYLLWLDVMSVEGRKEEKCEEIKGKTI